MPKIKLKDVTEIDIHSHVDKRGELKIIDRIKGARFFWMYCNGSKRAGHAHKKCKQIIFVIKGSLILRVIHKSGESKLYTFLQGDHALVIPPMLWVDIFPSKNSIVGVLADMRYDESDYIRNFEKFLSTK